MLLYQKDKKNLNSHLLMFPTKTSNPSSANYLNKKKKVHEDNFVHPFGNPARNHAFCQLVSFGNGPKRDF